MSFTRTDVTVREAYLLRSVKNFIRLTAYGFCSAPASSGPALFASSSRITSGSKT